MICPAESKYATSVPCGIAFGSALQVIVVEEELPVTLVVFLVSSTTPTILTGNAAVVNVFPIWTAFALFPVSKYPGTELVIKAQVHAGGRGKGTFVDGFKSGVHFSFECVVCRLPFVSNRPFRAHADLLDIAHEQIRRGRYLGL